MFWIGADNTNTALASDCFTFDTHFSYGCSNFHSSLNFVFSFKKYQSLPRYQHQMVKLYGHLDNV